MPKTKTLYVKCNYVDGKFHMIFLSLTFLYPSYLSCSVTNSSFLYLTSTIYIYIQYFPYLFLQCRMSLEIPFFQAHFFLEYNLFVLEIPTSTRQVGIYDLYKWWLLCISYIQLCEYVNLLMKLASYGLPYQSYVWKSKGM